MTDLAYQLFGVGLAEGSLAYQLFGVDVAHPAEGSLLQLAIQVVK